MLFEDHFRTITEPSTGEFKDRGSTFIGFAYPVTSETEVKELISNLKKLHPKANHHCYAFRLGADQLAFRFSDDREPSGSAGKPIFGVIRALDLTNILIVVVRYFGGSLLGVPGLINAYRNAAQAAMDAAEIIEKPISEKYKLTFGYEVLKEVNTILRISGAEIITRKMESNCELTFEISKKMADPLISKLKSHHLLEGKCKIEAL